MEKKEEVGSGYLEPMQIGEKQEFRVMTVFLWQSCSSRFLSGDAMYILSLWGPVIDYFFL